MNKITRNLTNSSLQSCTKTAFFSSLIFFLSFNTLKGQTIKTFVDELAKPLMVENEILGISICITVNGKHSFYNYGVLSKDTEAKVTNKTLFELGSISKTFTASLASLSQIEV
ncbi:serine hydrolase [Pedobacter sp. N36a]|nr:serine hydrolase [Pedobacter sp. N36a]MBC8988065.1 serine hydrolase [Pedobacter sp. N36a]